MRLPFRSLMLPMFLAAISANAARFSALPISTSEPSLEAACINCSSDEFTICASPLTSIATPAGITPNVSVTSSPYFW